MRCYCEFPERVPGLGWGGQDTCRSCQGDLDDDPAGYDGNQWAREQAQTRLCNFNSSHLPSPANTSERWTCLEGQKYRVNIGIYAGSWKVCEGHMRTLVERTHRDPYNHTLVIKVWELDSNKLIATIQANQLTRARQKLEITRHSTPIGLKLK